MHSLPLTAYVIRDTQSLNQSHSKIIMFDSVFALRCIYRVFKRTEDSTEAICQVLGHDGQRLKARPATAINLLCLYTFNKSEHHHYRSTRSLLQRARLWETALLPQEIIRRQRVPASLCPWQNIVCRRCFSVEMNRIHAVLVCFATCGRELVVFAVAVGAAFCVVGAYDQGSQGGETSSDDGNGVFNHGNGAGQHGFIALGVVGPNDCLRCQPRLCVWRLRGYSLLAITTKKPRAKTVPTAILSLSFICSRETMVMGRQMMITSVKMLTKSGRVSEGKAEYAMRELTKNCYPVINLGSFWTTLICR
jgi:hypothetical protein